MPDPPLDLLTRMTRLICHAVEAVDGCGITIVHHGEPMTVAYSSEVAALNDELQYTENAGPCLQALRSRSVVECPDFSGESRWGAYPAAALDCGMRSVLSLPIDAGEAGNGAFNLYSRAVRGFEDGARRVFLEFADITADVVAASARVGPVPGAARQWHDALEHRTAVAQAVGILMARHRCGRDEAFLLLLDSGRERGEDLYTAAARIGTTVGR